MTRMIERISPSERAQITARRLLASTTYRSVCFFGLALNAYLVVTMLLMDVNTISTQSSAWYSPSVATCDLIEFVILAMLATEICIHAVAEWGGETLSRILYRENQPDVVQPHFFAFWKANECLIHTLHGLGYFSNFWNWLDLTVLLVCLVVLILTLDHPLGKHPTSGGSGPEHGSTKSSLDVAAMALRYILQFSRLAVLWNFERERQEVVFHVN